MSDGSHWDSTDRELKNLELWRRRLAATHAEHEDREAIEMQVRRSARIVAATQRGRSRQAARLVAEALAQDGVEHQDGADGGPDDAGDLDGMVPVVEDPLHVEHEVVGVEL
jgi:hypothetical protein